MKLTKPAQGKCGRRLCSLSAVLGGPLGHEPNAAGPMTYWLKRVTVRYFSTRETIRSMPVVLFMPLSDAERTLVFGKLDAALALIATHLPGRFAGLIADVQEILVCGRPDMIGQYHPEHKVCELYVDWVRREDVSPELVAATIVHEAEHARLWRLGYGYAPERQQRIERICHRAERIFGRRLRDGAAVIAQAQAGMNLGGTFYHGQQRRVRERAALEKLAKASTFVRPLVWFYDAREWLRRRRAAQQ
jgi:hypothetical protein